MTVTNKTTDVAIIGAGFAGLSAAHALRAGGASVLLLEAQEQAGGRVQTIRHADGHAYGKGGQFYCSDMTRICKAVEDHGLSRREVRKLPGVVAMLGGQRKLLETDFLEHDFFAMVFDADPQQPGSLLDWALSLGLSDERVAMIRSGCEEVIGRPIEELSFRSTLDCLSRFETFENTMEYSCVEGMGTLAGRMAAALGDRFLADAPVMAVDRRNGLFHLSTPQGRVEARRVIFAAGPVVLSRIDWRSPQDQWLRQVPDQFVSGKMVKIVMRYDSAFWIGSDFGWLGQIDAPAGLSVMEASDAAGGMDALAVFCGGTAATELDGLSEAATLARVLDLIEPLLGPGYASRSLWSNRSGPITRGSAAAMPPGRDPGRRLTPGRRCANPMTGSGSPGWNCPARSPPSSRARFALARKSQSASWRRTEPSTPSSQRPLHAHDPSQDPCRRSGQPLRAGRPPAACPVRRKAHRRRRCRAFGPDNGARAGCFGRRCDRGRGPRPDRRAHLDLARMGRFADGHGRKLDPRS
jgi:monoamine oxidase